MRGPVKTREPLRRQRAGAAQALWPGQCGMLGEGQTQVPAGSVLLMRMLGTDNGIELFEKHIPIEVFWTNLALWKHAPEYVYWMHAVDYDRAVRMVRELRAA